jgi:hypothetical protein
LSRSPVPDCKKLHEGFWDWIFKTPDGNNHPLKVSGGGTADLKVGNALILSGSLQRDGQKNRSLRIPDGVEFIFVPADNVLCTDSDGDGPDLIACATNDINRGANRAHVTVDGRPQGVSPLPPHEFDLNIRQRIVGTGNSGQGEPLGQTKAAAAAYYAIIPANSLRSGNSIRISGRDIDVTYNVT